MDGETHGLYSVVDGADAALNSLFLSVYSQLPDEIIDYAKDVLFSSPSLCGAPLQFPCPLREQEAAAAIKALEACVVAAIADLRYGVKPRPICIDMEKIACFLMSAYLTTIDGLGKGDLRVREKIPGSIYNPHSLILPAAYIVLWPRYGPESGTVESVPSTLSKSL